jgi:outer membrane receptor protein involved in Fe transport
MKLLRRAALLAVLPLTIFVGNTFAQGVQTGILTGTVRDAGNLVLPGVTVTIDSPALQGTRTAVTDVNGVYVFRALPPGVYTVTFELVGMATREERATVELGRQTSVDTTLQLAALEEVVTVMGELPSALATIQTGANYRREELDRLPVGRTPGQIAELAPGLTDNTPNAGQVTIAGSFAYDNVFMVNGVDVNDNLFGTANNLFIEDAIQETAILTTGISAEYGRFSGGVVNMITRSGGNDFSGSFRTNFTNPSWTQVTPFEANLGQTRESDLNQTYEGTFGGPILRDRVWFFTAGRWSDLTDNQVLRETGLPFTRTTENRRVEAKVTGTMAANHTLQGNYIRNQTNAFRTAFGFSIDPAVAESPEFPNDLVSLSYNGVLTPRLLANLQFSRKTFGFRDTGGLSTDPFDSPMITRGILGVPSTLHYNAPYFDATDPEDRNNRQFAGSLSYFLSTNNWGSHDFKGGVEHFNSTRTGGNSQSATGFVVYTDYLTADGAPAVDANNRLIPRWVPGHSRIQNWLPVRGAQIDIRTLSLFLQNNWTVNPRLTLNLGARYEQVRGEATGDIVTVDTDTIVPRLGASYDLFGNGGTIVQASYAMYSGKYSESQFAENTPVGNPSLVLYQYTGPEGQGREFAPGYDLANYQIIGGNFPLANVFMDAGISSPVTREFAFSIGQNIGQRGFAKLTFSDRSMSSFVEDFIDDPSPAGKTTVVVDGLNFGTFDNTVYRNSDIPVREYRGLQLQSNYRLFDNLSIEGHYTLQIRNRGNFEGEATNQPGISSLVGDYPEILVAQRNYPVGRVNDFQRHKMRLWAIYTQRLGRIGALDIAPILRVDSPLTFSYTATGVPLSAVQLARNPGYARLPGGGTQTLFFGERGAGEFAGYALFDLALSYAVPVVRNLSPWVKVEVLNVTNNQKLTQWDTTVRPDPNSPLDEHGLRTGFIEGPRFGEGTAATHYPRWRSGFTGGRTFLVAGGFRF